MATDIDDERIYTVKDVADLIGVRPRFIQTQVQSKKLGAIVIGDKRPLIRIRGSDVKRWLEDHYVAPITSRSDGPGDNGS